MVEDFINKKSLAKIGYHFDPKFLSDFEVSCFQVIATKFTELEAAEIKKK